MKTTSKKYFDIGRKIQLARERAGMSQLQLAEKLGFQSATAISLIESAERKISVHGLQEISKILHVDISSFLGGISHGNDIKAALRADKEITEKDEEKIIDYIEYIKSKKRGR